MIDIAHHLTAEHCPALREPVTAPDEEDDRDRELRTTG